MRFNSNTRRIASGLSAELHLFCSLLQACFLGDSNRLAPYLPAAFAAKCFPGLLRPGDSHAVQLHIVEVKEDGTDSTPTAAGAGWKWLVVLKEGVVYCCLNQHCGYGLGGCCYWQCFMRGCDLATHSMRGKSHVAPVTMSVGSMHSLQHISPLTAGSDQNAIAVMMW
jgi:hypothetical protein